MLSHGFYEKGAIMKNTKKYKIIILLSYFISIFVWNIFRFLLQLLQYAVFKLRDCLWKFCNFALSNNNGDATPALIRIQG